MKQKDWALIIIVSFISGVVALVLSNLVISAPKNRQQKASIVEPITDEFKQPDGRFFNSQSIDPTQIIRIGDGSNNAPFKPNSTE